MAEQEPINVKAEVIGEDGAPLHLDRGYLVIAIAFIVIGAALLINPLFSLEIVCYVIGLALVVAGIVGCYNGARQRYNGAPGSVLTFLGIVLIIAGMLVIMLRGLIIASLPIIVGTILIIGAIYKLLSGVGLRQDGVNSWPGLVVASVVMIVLAAVMIFHPFAAASVMMRFLGAILLIDGAVNLWYLYVARGKPRIWQRFGRQ